MFLYTVPWLLYVGIWYLGRRKFICASWGFWLLVAFIHRFFAGPRVQNVGDSNELDLSVDGSAYQVKDLQQLIGRA